MRLLDGPGPQVHLGQLVVSAVPREDLARLPRLQTMDGDIPRASEKSASLICVCFIGVHSTSVTQSRGRMGQGITSNQGPVAEMR